MKLTNYHTHMYLCRHATGTSEDYILKAIEEGYSEIGISDHGPYHDYLKRKLNSRRMTMNEFFNDYIPDLNRLKEQYKDQIKVLSSIEMEYVPDMKSYLPVLRKQVDYMILGQHVYYKNGYYYNVYADNKYEYPVCKILSEDLEIYADQVEEALNTGYFEILAHPEILMIAYPKWDKHSEKMARRIIEVAIKNNVYLEFNVNGLRRTAYRPEGYLYGDLYMYPRGEFWNLVINEYKYDKILINDDCHHLKHFNDDKTKMVREYFINNNIPFKDTMEL